MKTARRDLVAQLETELLLSGKQPEKTAEKPLSHANIQSALVS